MSPSKLVKLITLTAQATESHNRYKIISILKWLKSGHDVRVSITGSSDRQKQMESICQLIEKDAKSGSRLLQKQIKPQSIKFTLQANENSPNLIIDETPKTAKDNISEGIDLTSGKDVFSEEFERELDQSIKEEMSKNKKKR